MNYTESNQVLTEQYVVPLDINSLKRKKFFIFIKMQ